MTGRSLLSMAQRYAAMVCAASLVGGFWGFLGAAAARLTLGISEEDALLFVGLPVAVVLGIFMWPRLPRILGFEDPDRESGVPPS